MVYLTGDGDGAGGVNNINRNYCGGKPKTKRQKKKIIVTLTTRKHRNRFKSLEIENIKPCYKKSLDIQCQV